MTPAPLRLSLAALSAFAIAWAGLRLAAKPAPRAEALSPHGLRILKEMGGIPASCRRVTFNGTPSLVAICRFPSPPGELLKCLAGRLEERRMEGKELGAGLAPFTAQDRESFLAGTLFMVDRSGGADRLAWRDPEAGLVEVCLRPDGTGTSALWSEREGRGWIPDGGDCPGRDLEGVGRPPGWQRLFCIDGGESLMLCYVAPLPPTQAQEALGRRMEEAGWRREAARGLPASAYTRGRSRCLLSALPAPEGSQVSVVRMQGSS